MAGRTALTLTQPWATLVVAGLKHIETRSWTTSHRGQLCIHAAKGFPRWARELCDKEPYRTALSSQGVRQPADLPRGALLGVVTLLDCIPTTSLELASIGHRERAFGDYSEGRWAWLLDEPVAFDEPRPCRGSLSLWTVPDATARDREERA